MLMSRIGLTTVYPRWRGELLNVITPYDVVPVYPRWRGELTSMSTGG